jgi:ferredoxin-fold anticodon binding domain-containing protein
MAVDLSAKLCQADLVAHKSEHRLSRKRREDIKMKVFEVSLLISAWRDATIAIYLSGGV